HDYLLKTESMERIEAAVRSAQKMMQQELTENKRQAWLSEQTLKALPELQRFYIRNLVEDMVRSHDLKEQFTNLGLPFACMDKTSVIHYQVEDWSKYTSRGDQSLMLFAMSNMITELLSPHTVSVTFDSELQNLVTVVQPLPKHRKASGGFTEETWKRML